MEEHALFDVKVVESVTQRYGSSAQNIAIDLSAVSPRYIGAHNTGWEPRMRYGNTTIQDKVEKYSLGIEKPVTATGYW